MLSSYGPSVVGGGGGLTGDDVLVAVPVDVGGACDGGWSGGAVSWFSFTPVGGYRGLRGRTRPKADGTGLIAAAAPAGGGPGGAGGGLHCLLPALCLACIPHLHVETKGAPLELENPPGVALWANTDMNRTLRYPAAAQWGTHPEKKAYDAFPTRLLRLAARVRRSVAAAQQRFKRKHDAHLQPKPEGLEVSRNAFMRYHDYKDCKVGSFAH